jgi:hypothetical protein
MGRAFISPSLRHAVRGARVAAAAPPAEEESWWLAGDVNAANAKAVYQPIGAADLAASYVNLANPGTNNAAPGVAPTFNAATGWTFNGSTQYLDTGLAPAHGWSMLVRFSGGTNTGFVAGAGTSTESFYFRPNNAAAGRAYGYGNLKTVAGALTAGVMGMGGATAYLNGASEGAIGGTIAGTPPEVVIGARRSASVATFFAGSVQAFALYDTTLSAEQVADISAAMALLA